MHAACQQRARALPDQSRYLLGSTALLSRVTASSRRVRQSMTVHGPISPDALGVTLRHEHLLCDLRPLWHPPPPYPHLYL